jgi:hypothetical protein
MGTRRKKRNTLKTRKKRGGAIEWTSNKRKSVKRRSNLLALTSNSTQKSNRARRAIRNYRSSVQGEHYVRGISREEVLTAITPQYLKPENLQQYIEFSIKECADLIVSKIDMMMRQEKDVNQKRILSNQTTFLANRAAARVKEAAHIASMGRLSNLSVDPAVRAELDEWNASARQRELDQEQNIEEAKRIFNKNEAIQAKAIRLEYELTKQVADYVEKLDFIISDKDVSKIDNDISGTVAKTIVLNARAKILKIIPRLNGLVSIDRALPKLMEKIMQILGTASAEYVKTVKGELQIAKARLQYLRIREKQIRLNRLHFKILRAYDTRLGPVLSGDRFPDDAYHEILHQIDEQQREVQRLERE